MLEKETLSEVLNFLKCSELPDPLKKGKVWVRAIAKAKKANNHETMCYVVNNGRGVPLLKRDFGSISMIKDFVEIYPLSYLESGAFPDFRKKDDVIQFLVRHGEDEAEVTELVKSDDKELRDEAKARVISYCIKAQLEQENMKSKAPNSRDSEAHSERQPNGTSYKEENNEQEKLSDDNAAIQQDNGKEAGVTEGSAE